MSRCHLDSWKEIPGKLWCPQSVSGCFSLTHLPRTVQRERKSKHQRILVTAARQVSTAQPVVTGRGRGKTVDSTRLRPPRSQLGRWLQQSLFSGNGSEFDRWRAGEGSFRPLGKTGPTQFSRLSVQQWTSFSSSEEVWRPLPCPASHYRREGKDNL